MDAVEGLVGGFHFVDHVFVGEIADIDEAEVVGFALAVEVSAEGDFVAIHEPHGGDPMGMSEEDPVDFLVISAPFFLGGDIGAEGEESAAADGQAVFAEEDGFIGGHGVGFDVLFEDRIGGG